jgi:hypothetical protein
MANTTTAEAENYLHPDVAVVSVLVKNLSVSELVRIAEVLTAANTNTFDHPAIKSVVRERFGYNDITKIPSFMSSAVMRLIISALKVCDVECIDEMITHGMCEVEDIYPIACAQGCMKVIEMCLANLNDVKLINVGLEAACSGGHLEIAQSIAAHLGDAADYTPAVYASIRNSRHYVLEWLVSKEMMIDYALLGATLQGTQCPKTIRLIHQVTPECMRKHLIDVPKPEVQLARDLCAKCKPVNLYERIGSLPDPEAFVTVHAMSITETKVLRNLHSQCKTDSAKYALLRSAACKGKVSLVKEFSEGVVHRRQAIFEGLVLSNNMQAVREFDDCAEYIPALLPHVQRLKYRQMYYLLCSKM